ncbi:17S U2 SnRNP complex component HTATSF1-like [Hyperolius riggenbachi]|uniref:17S U2 SnRNP complex component HTATSF1-like n=1 Tax=Hyperolius riggenbachi TaxID=752182 RepID=UPI0035A2EBD0
MQIEVKKKEEETYVRSDQQPMEEGDIMGTMKEEENETYVRNDQQSMDEGDMMGTIKEEEETYVRSDQQSMEKDDMMGTIKEEEEETYVRDDQQSLEEGDMMRTIKDEKEEAYVRDDQQSMEEGDMMRTIKEEEEETYVRDDQQSMKDSEMIRNGKEQEFSVEISTAGGHNVLNTSAGYLMSHPDVTAEHNGVTQSSPIIGNTHQRGHRAVGRTVPSYGEESNTKSQAVTPDTLLSCYRAETSTDPSILEDFSYEPSHIATQRDSQRFPSHEASLAVHQRIKYILKNSYLHVQSAGNIVDGNQTLLLT